MSSEVWRGLQFTGKSDMTERLSHTHKKGMVLHPFSALPVQSRIRSEPGSLLNACLTRYFEA